MNTNRILYLIGFFVFSFFALNFFESTQREKTINETGIPVLAKVAGVPNCGRSSNTIDVKIEQKTYNISIGKNDCIQGFYKVGDTLKVLYSSVYDRAQRPEQFTYFSYIVSILFFCLPIYFLLLLIKPFKSK